MSGRAVQLRRAKDRALVAYLAVNRGKYFRRTSVSALLWGDVIEKKSRHSLNQSLYAIRRILPRLIRSDNNLVGCDAELVTTDLDLFAQRVARGEILLALELIEAGFLDDLSVTNGNGFEEWRDNFANAFFHIQDQRIFSELTRQSPPSASALLPRLSPLITELFPNTTQYIHNTCQRITNAQAQPVSHVGIANGARESNYSKDYWRPLGSSHAPFVGRGEQLAKLDQLWRSICAGEANFALVFGNPGFGKTRLVEEFIGRVSAARVFKSRCYESDRPIGFASVIGLFQSLTPDDVQGVDGIWSATLSEILPTVFPSPAPPSLGSAAAKARLFEALLNLLLILGEKQPTLIFLDDVQWADKSSILLLSYLSHRLRRGRVLFVAATRPVRARESMLLWNEWQPIKVAELGHGDIYTLLQKSGDEADIQKQVDVLERMTGGHPYLLLETLHAHTSAPLCSAKCEYVSATVVDYLEAQLRSIPNSIRRVISVLAVFGRPMPARLAYLIAGRSARHVDADLEKAGGLVSAFNGKLALRHDLIREVAYSRIASRERAELHRRIATQLASSKRFTGQAAYHFFKGRQPTKAHFYSVRAYAQAEASHATDESIDFLRLAIRSRPDSSEIWRLKLAENLWRAHRFTEALTEVKQLRSKHPGCSACEIELLELELKDELSHGFYVERKEELNRYLQNPALSLAIRVRALRIALRSAFHSADKDALERNISELLTHAKDLNTPEMIEATAFAVRMQSLTASSFDAERWIQPIMNTPYFRDNPELRLRVGGLLATILYEVGRFREAEKMHRDLMREIEEVGAMNYWPLAAGHIHMLLVEQGSYEEASQFAPIVRARSTAMNALHALAALHANEASMYYEMGDYTTAEERLVTAKKYVEKTDATWMELELKGLYGLVLMAQGRLSDAVRISNASVRKLESIGFRAADVSHLEILIYKVTSMLGNPRSAIKRLSAAVHDYQYRDVACRLRMEIELANALRPSNGDESRYMAKKVFEEASLIGARPIADRADALLYRL